MRRALFFIAGIILGVVAILVSKPLYKKYKAATVTNLADKVQSTYGTSVAPNIDMSEPISPDVYSEFKDPTGKKPILKVRVINWDRNSRPEKARSMFHEILAEKYSLEYSHDHYDILISSYHKYDQVPLKQDKVVSLYYTWEAYVGDPKPFLDQLDLALGFDFIDSPNYIRFPLYYSYYGSKVSHDFKRSGTCSPSDKEYFACFLASNHGDWFPDISDGVYARDRLFHRLSTYKKVMSGGKHLNNIGGMLPWEKTVEWFGKCKFIIAYENTLNYPGYATEKLFQAWHTGSVPIYNTHPAALKELNSKAFIYGGDFANDEELAEYIKKVDQDDKLYCDIWNERLITDPSLDYEALKDRVRKKLFEVVEKKLGR